MATPVHLNPLHESEGGLPYGSPYGNLFLFGRLITPLVVLPYAPYGYRGRIGERPNPPLPTDIIREPRLNWQHTGPVTTKTGGDK